MKYITEFRRTELAEGLISDIRQKSKRKVRFMEFCGGHSVAIFKYGLRQLFPSNIEMLSGPGCPVCVTAAGDLDKAIALGKERGVIITSSGTWCGCRGAVPACKKLKPRARMCASFTPPRTL